MKILLDENIPHDLRHFLPGHEVLTVAYMGWHSLENGTLLKAAADGGFDVMLTKDSGVEYEQHLSDLPVSVLVIRAKTNKLDDIRPLVSAILSALNTLEPRTFVRVGG
jgi:predicted nuclease of predicted toxin-antitoxin system